ncbi:MAG: hypothetical protein KQA31_02980 [Candidatus Aenigmarchaeota archaeon]|nr:hypothetical protein [Candidatus Aenigmarchaeota archaeon]
MLKKISFLLIFLFFVNLSFAIEIKTCYFDSKEPWKCLLGEKCTCEIEGDCTNGNLALYYSSPVNPVCYPKIKDNKVEIDLVLCNVDKTKINATAICDEGMSRSKQIDVLLERLPACIWNETIEKCQKNSSPFAEKCSSQNICVLKEEGVCECKSQTYSTTTFQTSSLLFNTTTSTTVRNTSSTTTTTLKDCPYQCCDGIRGYKDLECETGYVCCKDENDEYYCRRGNSCIEEVKAKGFSGWIIILIIIILSAVGGAVYYFSKTKVNLQDKYRF